MTPSPTTLLRLDGRDALDLLHRISTQHLRQLEPGHCRATLFCDFRGRVLHRAAVARGADGAVWLLRPDAAGAELFGVIDKQIFRDRLSIEDLSTRATVTAIAAAANTAPGTLDELDGLPVRVRIAGGVDLVLAAPAGTVALDEAARIRLGAPRHGHEIREDFNAFEAGLARDVHLDKGCFTGQEALLRMVTYKGVRRRPVMLEGDATPPFASDVVRQSDADAGVVTSVAMEGTSWVALAIVRHDALAAGGPLVTTGGAAVTRVTRFPDARPLGLPDSAPTP